jgi:dimethylargininase
MSQAAQRVLALTRDISPAIEHCELTHLERVTIDVERARAQHSDYEGTLRKLGCEVRRLPASDDMLDSVFIEDTAVVLDELAVITRPGAESRRKETAAVAEAVRSYRPVVAILAPGTLDGGDVMVAGQRIFVGVGYRSNEAAVKQLRSMVGTQGYTVESVEFEGCLHLKSAVTVLSDDLVLVNPAWVDARRFAPLHAIEIDPAEPYAANAVRIGDDIMYAEHHVRTHQRLADAGLTIHTVPADELAKAEGAVTCCSLIIDLAPA